MSRLWLNNTEAQIGRHLLASFPLSSFFDIPFSCTIVVQLQLLLKRLFLPANIFARGQTHQRVELNVFIVLSICLDSEYSPLDPESGQSAYYDNQPIMGEKNIEQTQEVSGTLYPEEVCARGKTQKFVKTTLKKRT